MHPDWHPLLNTDFDGGSPPRWLKLSVVALALVFVVIWSLA